MFEKALVLFFSGRLGNYAWFFGFMALTLAAVTGMAWAYCGSDSKKQGCCVSEKAPDIRAAEKGAAK